MIYHARNEDTCGDPNNLEGYGDDVKRTIRALQSRRDEFDAIIVTGMSGVLVGGPVTLATGIPLMILRKATDDCHAYTKTINESAIQEGTRVLFLDDFVSMGETRARCNEFVERRGGKMVLQFMYGAADGGSDPDGWEVLDYERILSEA